MREDPSTHIIIKGANINNLNKVNVAIPKNQFVVVTGVSGSGKSSLTMDTLYAEGQRRYVESLSSYARQFLERKEKPDVDYIKGLAPAIAIEQRVSLRTTRSTVGTLTELYDYLRLLYAKAGETFSPVSGKKVIQHEVQDVIEHLKQQKEELKIQILAPLDSDEPLQKNAQNCLQKGFLRFLINNKTVRIEDILDKNIATDLKSIQEVYLLVDRLVTKNDTEFLDRAADSINIAFDEGENICLLDLGDGELTTFSRRFERDGIKFEIPTPHFFNFNSPYGACPSCEGFGTIIGIDKDLVIPDKTLSIYDGAVAAWKGEKMSWYKNEFVRNAHLFDFPVHKAIIDLSEEQLQTLWEGNEHAMGLNGFFKEVEEQTYKIQYRVMLSRYRGRTGCTTCSGTRLRKETAYVQIGGKPIGALLTMPVRDLASFFNEIKLTSYQKQVSERILVEVKHRLQFLIDVGLDYLNLNRVSNSLSGGETQRIHLTRTLGSNLTGSIYILDEPSIGLHPHDSARLINVLMHLRNLGNTVIVVEHEEDIIRAADFLIDVGPEAGSLGGDIVFAGKMEDVFKTPTSLTTKYLEGTLSIPTPETRRNPYDFIEIIGAKQFNLKDIDIKIPINALSVVTGVSGSGKTTLIRHILYPSLKRELEGHGTKPGLHRKLTGALNRIKKVEMVDQNPIGRSSRSNPVTYIKAYDAIRELFSKQPVSKIRNYKPKHFSFNVDGGRCDNCKGEGETIVEMQFLADIHLTCEVCKGRRFKQDVLEAKYHEKSIADVLDMTIDDAIEFFSDIKEVRQKLAPLAAVGLGYVHLGQSSSTLSGGEAQRVKLAAFLSKGSTADPVLFIFDEPTTGLHFHDINKLLAAFNALIEKGHSVLVIEHNLDVIKCADWVVDLGPGGGDDGGQLIYQGTPEGLVEVEASLTGLHLKEKL
ncbi:MAG: excinuclease ABC subunit UvrA [Bacteroidetes bacterium]|nr:excinuclease ABC subunit UvrA [Bacteroidota bacterium]